MNSLTDDVSSVQPLVDVDMDQWKERPIIPTSPLGSMEVPDLIHCFHNNILIYWVLFCPFVLIIFYSLKRAV